MCFMVSYVGLDDYKAIALIGNNSVLYTAPPRNNNFPHTFCMNFLHFMSISGAVDFCAAY